MGMLSSGQQYHRPFPRKMAEIRELMERAYALAIRGRYVPSHKLRQLPWDFFEELTTGKREARPRRADNTWVCQLHWACWELARSLLDESVKNCVGLAIYYNAMNDERKLSELYKRLPKTQLAYVSDHVVWSLHFTNYHAVLAGLHLGGVIPCHSKFWFRRMDHGHRWVPQDGTWSKGRKHLPQEAVLRQYDAMAKKMQWFPRRPLRDLKDLREEVTYHTYKLGGTEFQWSLNTLPEYFPELHSFQAEMLDLLRYFGANHSEPSGQAYKPSLRIGPLETRFDEYTAFCDDNDLL